MKKLSDKDEGQQDRPQMISVWDPLVRLGHWSLLILMIYLIGFENVFPGHEVAGYLVLAIVIWRIIWGFWGTRFARFSEFWFSPKETILYTLAALRMQKAPEYTSHNPMGALMVYSFLWVLPLMVLSGMILLGVQRLDGPFAELFPENWEEPVETLHYGLVYIFEGLAVVHVLGMLWASWWHRENYILAMFNGKKYRFHRRSQRTTAEDRGSDLNLANPTPK